MLNKINSWWYRNLETIATFATIIALIELFLVVLFAMGMIANVQFIHDLEVQLTAHGVDWALYTPAP